MWKNLKTELAITKHYEAMDMKVMVNLTEEYIYKMCFELLRLIVYIPSNFQNNNNNNNKINKNLGTHNNF